MHIAKAVLHLYIDDGFSPTWAYVKLTPYL